MTDKSLRARLAEIEQPQTGSIRVEGLGPAARIWARPAVHRLVPAFVAVGLAALHGRWVWRFDRERRQHALAWADAMLGGGDPTTIERLARRGLVEGAIKDELAFRPWQARRVPVEGADRLRAIVESGRGAVLVFPHLGPIAGTWEALAEQGFKAYVVRKRPARETNLRGLMGARSAGILRRLEADGWRFLQPGGLFALMRELLARGEICMLAIDAASTAAVAWNEELDDLAMFKRGAATLAFEADVPVIAALTVRRRSGQRVWLADPLDPADFESPNQLHSRAVAQVKQVMEQYPPQIYPHRLLTPKLVEQRQTVKRAKEERRRRRARAKELRRNLRPVQRQLAEVAERSARWADEDERRRTARPPGSGSR